MKEHYDFTDWAGFMGPDVIRPSGGVSEITESGRPKPNEKSIYALHLLLLKAAQKGETFSTGDAHCR